MFGPYETYESRAQLVTPVFEYQFAASQRLRPFASFGLGYTKWRTLIPSFREGDPEKSVFEWDEQRGINLAGGFGLRLFLTKRLFVARRYGSDYFPFFVQPLPSATRFSSAPASSTRPEIGLPRTALLDSWLG